MLPNFKKLFVSISIAFAIITPASAGIFDDDEARKAIWDLRAKLEAQSELHARQINALQAELASKADKRAMLDLVNQLETMHQEVSQLRGLVEVLTHSLEQAQKREKDFYKDLDSRIKKVEPQLETIDGLEVLVTSEEKAMFNSAVELFKAEEYKQAATSFADFIRRYPGSGYSAQAMHYQGNSHYAAKDFKSALTLQQQVVKLYPNSSFAADALLNMASSHLELKDKPGATLVLKHILKLYSETEAAKLAKDRLQLLK